MEKHIDILKQLLGYYLTKYNNFEYNWESDNQKKLLIELYINYYLR